MSRRTFGRTTITYSSSCGSCVASKSSNLRRTLGRGASKRIARSAVFSLTRDSNSDRAYCLPLCGILLRANPRPRAPSAKIVAFLAASRSGLTSRRRRGGPSLGARASRGASGGGSGGRVAGAYLRASSARRRSQMARSGKRSAHASAAFFLIVLRRAEVGVCVGESSRSSEVSQSGDFLRLTTRYFDRTETFALFMQVTVIQGPASVKLRKLHPSPPAPTWRRSSASVDSGALGPQSTELLD